MGHNVWSHASRSDTLNSHSPPNHYFLLHYIKGTLLSALSLNVGFVCKPWGTEYECKSCGCWVAFICWRLLLSSWCLPDDLHTSFCHENSTEINHTEWHPVRGLFTVSQSLEMNPVHSYWHTIAVGVLQTADEGHGWNIAPHLFQQRTCFMNYTCHAVFLVCHVGPVTWQMFLSFHVIPTPFSPFQNIKKLSSRKSLGPALLS